MESQTDRQTLSLEKMKPNELKEFFFLVFLSYFEVALNSNQDEISISIAFKPTIIRKKRKKNSFLKMILLLFTFVR